MNRKRFLNRQVFVVSVVANSPTKPAVQDHQEESTDSAAPPSPSPENHLPPNLVNQLVPKQPQSSNTNSGSSKSPSVQDKISQLEQQNKRKSDASPETSEVSRKEKKMLREMEKKQKKLEFKQKNKVELQHSF